jgi:poly-D-alanine transfer protein DltD
MAGHHHTWNDEGFLRNVEAAREWDDLDVLLRALRELGAEPLVMIVPPNGTYLDYTGVTARARARVHEKALTLARAHAVPLVDFAEYGNDKLFFSDVTHLSSRGWIYYSRVLDAFYHGQRGEALTSAPLRLTAAKPALGDKLAGRLP